MFPETTDFSRCVVHWYVFDEDDIKEDLRERTGNFENRTY